MSEPRIASAQDFGDAATEAATNRAADAEAEAATTASDAREEVTNRAADADAGAATTASDVSESPVQLPAIQGLEGLLGGAVSATTCSIDGTCD